MGEHRNSGGIRSISNGPLFTVGAIIVVVLAVFGWFELRDRIADQGTAAAETCVEGAETLSVTVDPDIASQVTDLATRFAATGPVVRDHCISVAVEVADSTAIAGALAAGEQSWDPSALGPIPALWIPRSSNSVTALPAGTVDGTPKTIASTPVVLAGSPQLTAALDARGVGWADLPALQSNPESLLGLSLPGWGALRMQLPVGPDSDATTAVLAAVGSSATPSSDVPRTTLQLPLKSPTRSALTALATTDRGVAAAVPDSTDMALSRLAGGLSPDADIHSVPVTEQQLGSSGQSELTGYAPPGSTVSIDYPSVIMSGSWVNETLRRAGAQFVEFILHAENSKMFTDAGYDLPGSSPLGAPTGPDVRSALLDAVTNPATERRSTVVVDLSTSMDTEEGGRSRLQNVASALTAQFDTVIDSTDLGLWSDGKDLDEDRPYRILVPTGTVSEQLPAGSRRQALIAAAQSLKPENVAATYPSMTEAYRAALEGFVPGRPNSIVLVTDGPNEDPAESSESVLADITKLVDPARPVAVDVVSIGTNADTGALEAVSTATGGTFTTVSSSDGSDLAALLGKFLY